MLRSVFGVILTLDVALIGASPPVAPGETIARPPAAGRRHRRKLQTVFGLAIRR